MIKALIEWAKETADDLKYELTPKQPQALAPLTALVRTLPGVLSAPLVIRKQSVVETAADLVLQHYFKLGSLDLAFFEDDFVPALSRLLLNEEAIISALPVEEPTTLKIGRDYREAIPKARKAALDCLLVLQKLRADLEKRHKPYAAKTLVKWGLSTTVSIPNAPQSNPVLSRYLDASSPLGDSRSINNSVPAVFQRAWAELEKSKGRL